MHQNSLRQPLLIHCFLAEEAVLKAAMALYGAFHGGQNMPTPDAMSMKV